MMMPDVLSSVFLLQEHDNKCSLIQVHMPLYLLDALYHHAAIGLMHNTEDALFMHIVNIAILATVMNNCSAAVLSGMFDFIVL